jgi:ribosomal protein S1
MKIQGNSVPRIRFEPSDPFEEIARLATARVLEVGAHNVVLLLGLTANGEGIRVTCPLLVGETVPAVDEVVQVLLSPGRVGGRLRGDVAAGAALARMRSLLAARDGERACKATLLRQMRKGWRAQTEGMPAFFSVRRSDVAVNSDGEIAVEGDTVEALISGYSRNWNCFNGVITAVVSRRSLILDELSNGAIVLGRVRSLVSYGAFISIKSKKHGPIDLLLRNAEASWQGLSARDVLSEGEEREFLVLLTASTDGGPAEIELSLKRLKPFATDVVVGEVYHGTIKNITGYGVFVELGHGSEGLLHFTAMSPPGIQGMLGKRFVKGQIVTVVVQSIDRERQRISLAQPPASDATIDEGVSEE